LPWLLQSQRVPATVSIHQTPISCPRLSQQGGNFLDFAYRLCNRSVITHSQNGHSALLLRLRRHHHGRNHPHGGRSSGDHYRLYRDSQFRRNPAQRSYGIFVVIKRDGLGGLSRWRDSRSWTDRRFMGNGFDLYREVCKAGDTLISPELSSVVGLIVLNLGSLQFLFFLFPSLHPELTRSRVRFSEIRLNFCPASRTLTPSYSVYRPESFRPLPSQ
jgi:hypothetical protein